MDEKELWDKFGYEKDKENVKLGLYTSHQFRNSRRHLLHTISRYKFAAKLIGKKGRRILDLGCNDGFGTYFLGEEAEYVEGMDFDQDAIKFAQAENSMRDIQFVQGDFLGKRWGERFDGIVSFDVIEHIPKQKEHTFIYDTVINNLTNNGVFIVGTPSLESQQYTSEYVKKGHINLYTGEMLKAMLETYFNYVFVFTQNDEIIHTGHFRMANYLIAVCCGQKELEHL